MSMARAKKDTESPAADQAPVEGAASTSEEATSTEVGAAEAGQEANSSAAAPANSAQASEPPRIGEPDPADFVVVVVGPKGGFRRAGREFGPEPVEIPLVDLSKDQQDALAREPRLIVNVIQVPASR